MKQRFQQTFQTDILDEITGSEASYYFIPSSIVPKLPSQEDEFRGILRDFGIKEDITFIEPHQLVAAVVFCLNSSNDEFQKAVGGMKPTDIDFKLEKYARQDLIQFAEHLVLSPVVPVRRNPLNLESLGSVITTASGVGLGAFAGFIVAGGTPLIFVTVPAGMIIFGAAAGVAKGLEKGLAARISKWIKGK